MQQKRWVMEIKEWKLSLVTTIVDDCHCQLLSVDKFISLIFRFHTEK